MRFDESGEPMFLTLGGKDDEWPVRWIGDEVVPPKV